MLARVPPQWRLLVTLMAFTGMRWGEASALRWGDINFELREISVYRGNWRGAEALPKTPRSRRKVPLPDQVAGVLEQMRRDLLQGNIKGGIKVDGLALFPSRHGQLHRGTPFERS